MSDSEPPVPLSSTEPIVPEIELASHLDLAMEDYSFPAYFAHDWAAGRALARYLLDRPEIVVERSVLDFGTGAGMVALAAKKAGARRVVGVDRDPRAVEALSRNAKLLGLAVEAVEANPLVDPLDHDDFDVVLAADVFYADAMPEGVWTWLFAQANRGRHVLVADPGRLAEIPAGVRLLCEMRGEGKFTSRVFEVVAGTGFAGPHT